MRVFRRTQQQPEMATRTRAYPLWDKPEVGLDLRIREYRRGNVVEDTGIQDAACRKEYQPVDAHLS